MNMNSLVIVSDAECARMFRTAKTAAPKAPVELVEIETIHASPAGPHEAARGARAAAAGTAPAAGGELAPFATQIAARAAQFAHYHFCNPVLVVASETVSTAIFAELERALPNAHVRRVVADLGALRAPEILRQLEDAAAFEPWPANTPGQVAL